MIDNPYGKPQKRVYISDVKCIFFDYLCGMRGGKRQFECRLRNAKYNCCNLSEAI